MKNGYWGKVLRVNLTNKSYQVENVDESVWEKFIGGSGYGAKVLIEETQPKVDPLSEENKIVFGVGLWQAVKAPGSAKWSVVTKSPLTKTYLDCAGAGHWAPLFKKAGYDALIIEGKSEKPVYININDDKVEFKDAAHIWGKDTIKTTEFIKEELNNKRVSILNIGPAGEIMNPIACITCDGHSFAGRGGAGAVMGSKNLKAIATFGTKEVLVFNPDKAKELAKKVFKFISDNVGGHGETYGTTQCVGPNEKSGDLPMKYWTQDTWPEVEKISTPRYNEVLSVKPHFCANCPVGCHRHIQVKEPKKWALEGNGPEYETLATMGGSYLCSDLAAICKANDICNRMGVDTISAGAWICFLAECWEKGLINEKDTDGIEIKWGNGEVLVELTEKITKLEGIASWFKNGIVGAAEKIGPETKDIIVQVKNLDYPAHDPQVKNLDYPAHDPRFSAALGVNYATSTRGACHVRGPVFDSMHLFYPNIFKGDFAEDNEENIPKRTFMVQNINGFYNQVSLCCFMGPFGGMKIEDVIDIINAVTGWNWSQEDLMEAGSRAFTLERLINVRDGFDRKSDTLPKKMTIAAKTGGRAGRISPSFESNLEKYYEIRGWDQQGHPTKETMKNLGLEEYIEYIV
jgi:aldehyde:ferredoxin oxidoreductase